MSWDHDTYKAKCRKCGYEGTCTVSSDDWGRSKTSWDGFQNVAPSATAVARMRVSAGDARPICACGSSDIERGALIGSR